MAGMAPIAALVPGNSVLHRTHPWPKMVWILMVVTFVFIMRNPFPLLAIAAFSLVLVVISGTWRSYWLSMVYLLPVIFALVFFQCIAPAFPRPWTAIVTAGPFTIYQEGIYSGIIMASRVISAATFALVMLMTTHPGDLFAALRVLKVPYEFNFMIITTIQLLPILQREFEIIFSAQKSRGMMASGFKALLPSMVPVFAGAIERVSQLSMSLESRAFGSSGIKTSLRQLRLSAMDVILTALGLAAFVGSFVMLFTVGTMDISKTIRFPEFVAYILWYGAILGFASTVYYFIRRFSAAK